MGKVIFNYIKLKNAEWMATRHPDFALLKSKDKGGRASRKSIFCKRLDDRRCAWLAVEFDPTSTSLLAAIYWTNSGDTLDQLEELVISDETAPRGWIGLTDERLVGDDLPFEGRRLLDLDDPTREIQRAAIDEWKKTEIYQKAHQILIQQMRKKNASVSDAEIEQEQERCNRASFKVWDPIERAMTLNEEQLEQAAGRLLGKLHYLTDRYAIPFLNRKLGA